MFRGSHELTLDNKGRLAIPAKFRDALSRDFDTQRIVATLDSRDRLLFYPEGEWEKVEQQKASQICSFIKICCCTMRKRWN